MDPYKGYSIRANDQNGIRHLPIAEQELESRTVDRLKSQVIYYVLCKEVATSGWLCFTNSADLSTGEVGG